MDTVRSMDEFPALAKMNVVSRSIFRSVIKGVIW